MIEIKKAKYDDATVKRLIELSRLWAEEDITFGLRPNQREDLQEPCFVALDEGTIVGYIFGHYYEADKKTTVHDIGEKCFEVDELYVQKEYRSKGIGKRLFQAMESEVKGKAACITLVTATKDYRRMLKFYDEDAGMTFHDAFLCKRI